MILDVNIVNIVSPLRVMACIYARVYMHKAGGLLEGRVHIYAP